MLSTPQCNDGNIKDRDIDMRPVEFPPVDKRFELDSPVIQFDKNLVVEIS